MVLIAIGLFLLAALLGVYLLSFVIQGKETPKAIAFIHGPLAVTGIILLIIYSILYAPAPIVALVIFILAAVGGLTLIFRDLTGKTLPVWMALGHGITAIIAFSLLLFFVVS